MPQPNRPRRLSSVTDFLKDSYIIDSEVDSGGSGIVFKAHKKGDVNNIVAIKFYIISAQSSFLHETRFRALILPEDEDVYHTEFEFLKKTRHPGIQELISYGILENAEMYFGNRLNIVLPENGQVKFLVSRFIDGFRLRDWIGQTVAAVEGRQRAIQLSSREARHAICGVLYELVETLAFIHQDRNYQHSDLRADNVVVHQASGRPVIIDFGYAHCFDPGIEKKNTQIRYLAGNVPDALRNDIDGLMRAAGGNVVNRDELKKRIFPGLDLYNLGLLLDDVIRIPGCEKILTSFDYEFLRLITHRLTKWEVARRSTATEIAAQLKKMLISLRSPRHSTSPGVDRHIALPTGGLDLTPTVEGLLNTRAMRRLQLLNQLSLVNLIYPGASQTRFEHSLAVYVTAARLVDSLSRSPRFRILFDESGVTKLLLVALLHDVNHFPFLHYFQEWNNPGLKQINILDLFCGGQTTGDSPSVYELLDQEDIDPVYLRTVLFEDYQTITDPQMQVIRSIVDSGVDVDKMTYVRDDARYTGVPFGTGVDYDALFEHADILRLRSSELSTADDENLAAGNHYHLCFGPGARSAVESLLMARFWNFRQIYWHHTNRAVSAMIMHVISKLFAGPEADFSEFIRNTIGKSEVGALEVLNDLHRKKYGQDAITADLGSRRRRLYKRIISVNAAWERGEGPAMGDNLQLFNDLSRLSQRERTNFLKVLRTNVRSVFRKQLGDRELGDDDLLLDVPGRSLDEQMGRVYVAQLKPDGRPEYYLQSPFIGQLREQFAALSRTIRIFVSPTIRDLVGERNIEVMGDALRTVVQDSLKESRGVPNMVK